MAENDHVIEELRHIVAQLRHAYAHLHAERVARQRTFADGLISPQICRIESLIQGLEMLNLDPHQPRNSGPARAQLSLLSEDHACPSPEPAQQAVDEPS